MSETKTEPERVTIVEVPMGGLYSPSNDSDGREMPLLRLLEAREKSFNGGEVFLSSNDELSAEAKKHNSSLNRDSSLSPQEKAAQFIVAVRARRPPTPL